MIDEMNTAEADFEARLHNVLRTTFPWISPGALNHQLTFTVKLGHATIEIDGKPKSAQGRLDALIQNGGENLAVLELKRPSHGLVESDLKQALSYARLVSPPAPLVVLSNGRETEVYCSYTGDKIEGSTLLEDQFLELVKSSSKVALNRKKDAIEMLLGPNEKVWSKVFLKISEDSFDELTGQLSDLLSPLTEGFRVPRIITSDILEEVSMGTAVSVISGPPLSGKTNVLAELFHELKEMNELCPLFVDCGDSSQGILRSISNQLSKALGWPVYIDAVRNWLRTISYRESGMGMVLLVDDVRSERIKEELTELTSSEYGARLQFVIALDENDSNGLLMRGGVRKKPTKLGRRSKSFPINPYNDSEIVTAASMLLNERVLLQKGYIHAAEYRSPWLLRSVVADAIAVGLPSDKKDVRVGVPPLVGLDLFGLCREPFIDSIEMRESYQDLAKAILEDYQKKIPPEDLLLKKHIFVLYAETMSALFSHERIKELEASGLVKKYMARERTIYVPRLQEFLAFELALEIEKRLAVLADEEKAADWLIRLSGLLPFGDVVAAKAIIGCVEGKVIPASFLMQLVAMAPSREILEAGTRARVFVSGDVVEGELDGFGVSEVDGSGVSFDVVTDDAILSFKNIEGWLILSHLAGMPIGALTKSQMVGRVDLYLMAQVGCCPFPLLRPQGTNQSIHTHDLPDGGSYLCGRDGMIEHITLSIFNTISRELEIGEALVDRACEIKKMPLLMRVSIALRALQETNDSRAAKWATEQLEAKIDPLLEQFFKNGCEFT